MMSRRSFGALIAVILAKLGFGARHVEARQPTGDDVNRIANEVLKKHGLPPIQPKQPSATDQLIGDYLDHISEHAEQLGVTEAPDIYLKKYAEMPAPMKHLAVCNLVLGQVINGGFGQFYHNSDCVVAPEVVVGFRATGEEELARIVEDSLKFFTSGMARDRAARQVQLLEEEDPAKVMYGERAGAFFRPLDTRFYEQIGDNGDAYMTRIIQRYPDLLT